MRFPREKTLADVRAEVLRLAEPFQPECEDPRTLTAAALPLVELTGGEPLLQKIHCR